MYFLPRKMIEKALYYTFVVVELSIYGHTNVYMKSNLLAVFI